MQKMLIVVICTFFAAVLNAILARILFIFIADAFFPFEGGLASAVALSFLAFPFFITETFVGFGIFLYFIKNSVLQKFYKKSYLWMIACFFIAIQLLQIYSVSIVEAAYKYFHNPIVTGSHSYDFSQDILITKRNAERSSLLIRDNVVIWNEEISDKEDDYSGVDEVFVFSFDPTRRTGDITRLGRGRGTFLYENGALTVIVYNLDGSVTHFNPRTSDRFTTGWIPLPPDSISRCPDSVISRFDFDIRQYACSDDHVVYIRESDKTLHLQPIQ